MALLNIFIVFFGFLASALSCQLSSVCDTECTALETSITNRSTSLNPRYRLLYHVSPPVGWMNDPNGFIYYKEKYHIFYQYYPYDSVHGDMFWGHSTSPDLVTWTTQVTALIPGTEQCFSGSAFILGSTLGLIYTGHVNGTTNDESQYLAFSDDGVIFHKYASNPVLRKSADLTPDFRDPKIWQHDGYWYVVIGSKTTDGKGQVLLYRSADLLTWSYLSVIAVVGNNTEGAYMMECPDFYELNGTYVLMVSPQGMNASGDRYKNTFQTGYMLGSFSYDTFTFTIKTDFQEIDYGHDFYATQSIEKDGKRIMVGWFGMWEVDYPEAEDGWVGALTTFRELTLKGDRILQTPIEAIKDLRASTALLNGALAFNNTIPGINQTAEIIITANWTLAVDLQLTGNTGGQNASLQWDPTTTKVIVNRGGDNIRQVEWTPNSSSTWRIFLDTSSIEMFCGEGEVVFSSRVYPLGGWVVTNMSQQDLNVEAYVLNRSVPE